MRTIKFRGKSIDGKEWLYGDLVSSADKKRFAILVNSKESYDECEVIPKTVGQFTGLLDKNGNEIYEGDILRLGNSPSGVCEVKWNESLASFCIQFFFENKVGTRALGEWVMCERKVEVIGNIFDNPELLKEGENE